MNVNFIALSLMLVLSMPWGVSNAAEAPASAPGEDTIVLNAQVQFMGGMGASGARSKPLEAAGELPAWMRARIARYTAKAYSGQADDGSIYTDNDVVTRSNAAGFKKTCVQEVGSNTIESKPGSPSGSLKGDQIVVLRGDLVNICN